MSAWYTTRDTSTWFEASDAQAWIPTSQNNNNVKSASLTQDLKNGKSEANRLSKEVKVENRRSINSTQQDQSYFEVNSSKTVDDQNAWNAYVLSNTPGYANEDPEAPIDPNAPIKPEKVVFSKLRRNVEIEEELNKQNLFKTELCQSWIETGACRYGPKCQYAHGKDELRTVIRHPKYKTENCKTFTNTGQCPYGKRCRFVHQLTQLRGDEPEEDVERLQLKLQQINLSLAPDPVFPATEPSPPSASVKKGSRLPFLQKLRKQL
jgi:hypothetical protein